MTSVVVRPRTSAPVNSKMMARTTACQSLRVLAPTEVAKALATSLAPLYGEKEREENRVSEWRKTEEVGSTLAFFMLSFLSAPLCSFHCF